MPTNNRLRLHDHKGIYNARPNPIEAGKNETIEIKMAATVSAGSRWPGGSNAKQGNVVIWSGEDGPADTLVPRLEGFDAIAGKGLGEARRRLSPHRRPDPGRAHAAA